VVARDDLSGGRGSGDDRGARSETNEENLNNFGKKTEKREIPSLVALQVCSAFAVFVSLCPFVVKEIERETEWCRLLLSGSGKSAESANETNERKKKKERVFFLYRNSQTLPAAISFVAAVAVAAPKVKNPDSLAVMASTVERGAREDEESEETEE
jgi:hypothetical protein